MKKSTGLRFTNFLTSSDTHSVNGVFIVSHVRPGLSSRLSWGRLQLFFIVCGFLLGLLHRKIKRLFFYIFYIIYSIHTGRGRRQRHTGNDRPLSSTSVCIKKKVAQRRKLHLMRKNLIWTLAFFPHTLSSQQQLCSLAFECVYRTFSFLLIERLTESKIHLNLFCIFGCCCCAAQTTGRLLRCMYFYFVTFSNSSFFVVLYLSFCSHFLIGCYTDMHVCMYIKHLWRECKSTYKRKKVISS